MSVSDWALVSATMIGPFVGAGLGAWVAIRLQTKQMHVEAETRRRLLEFDRELAATRRALNTSMGRVADAQARLRQAERRGFRARQWQEFVDAAVDLDALVMNVLSAEVIALRDAVARKLSDEAVAATSALAQLWPLNPEAAGEPEQLKGQLARQEECLNALRARLVAFEVEVVDRDGG